jgi:hypothetical protein
MVTQGTPANREINNSAWECDEVLVENNCDLIVLCPIRLLCPSSFPSPLFPPPFSLLDRRQGADLREKTYMYNTYKICSLPQKP